MGKRRSFIFIEGIEIVINALKVDNAIIVVDKSSKFLTSVVKQVSRNVDWLSVLELKNSSKLLFCIFSYNLFNNKP